MSLLEGKVALVTGGSRGIGAAICVGQYSTRACAGGRREEPTQRLATRFGECLSSDPHLVEQGPVHRGWLVVPGPG
jgi:NAD(P)-dependent dehydrogenase (short-subunit alcohol dehydrogenase family)